MCGTQWIEATYAFAETNNRNFQPERVPCYWWPDLSLPLSLPETQVTALRYIAGRTSKLSSGTASSTIAVFTGRDAAGKLMAAEALAYEMQRPLWRVDTREIGDFSIADFENYLVHTLNAASAENAILMVDNADGLSNALFRRIEGYRGLCILAIDATQEAAANLRNPTYFVVDFPFPYDNE